MPNPPIVNYDAEDKDDGEKAADHARQIKVEFIPSDVKFWFSELEDEMQMAGINKQWLKRSVLKRNLPVKQKEDVKAFLTLQQTEAGAHIYLDIKTELLRLYAPKPQESYRKALSRSMVGLPSQLGNQLVNDVCRKASKMSGCCCAPHVQALWEEKLPVNVRAHTSNMDFSSATYKQVFENADKVFLASKQVQVAAAAVATPTSTLDETLPAFDSQNQPQVAAVGRGRGNRGGRGQRGGRGGRGGGQGRGGGSGQGGGAPRGKRHSSNPPDSCCDRHYTHGDQAFYCLKPLTCPWVSKVIAPPK